MKRLGYHAFQDRRSGTTSFIRRLRSGQYPRFHVYVDDGDEVVFNVHYDEKKPSYGRGPRHSGQYDTPLVQQETERIKSYLNI